ncbi:mechanosensitive ion channel family protein [Reichenbachiella ulvae]|uniref:Mechanosensitive ion channel family protein n=1 Tax=Reichenbachiella ulvae TaxID=2980104 RepID=A0ABT3CQG2_9BACT|nr:mechanosensitive ion channel family protein [Reichenbachiella ulvae]MCV9385719.1 mechanosensitive ion channel family protein [Reichenbachiella ulvae]
MPKLSRLLFPLLVLLFFLFSTSIISVVDQPVVDELLVYWMPIRRIMIVLSVAWVLIVLAKLGKSILLKHYDVSIEDNLTSRKVHTQIRVLYKILVFFITLISAGMILISFEGIRQIGLGLFASAGVAGIILGFAAQKVLGLLLAGLQIAFAQPFRIDDAVIIENEWGWIEEINLTYIVVRIWDKRRLVVPTTYFLEKPFQNWTKSSAEIIGSVFIHTDYTIPFDALRDELDRILAATELWDGKVKVLQVTDAKEFSVESRILVSAKNSPTAWDLRVHVREKLISFIQKEYPESLPKTRIQIKEPSAA